MDKNRVWKFPIWLYLENKSQSLKTVVIFEISDPELPKK